MGVDAGGSAEGPIPYLTDDQQVFLECFSRVGRGASPMERALAVADEAERQGLRVSAMRAALLPRTGDFKEAIRWHRQAIAEDRTDRRLILESLIQMLDREADTTLEEARAIRQQWWDWYGWPAVARVRPHTNRKDPDKVITVGVISANFKHCSAGICLEAAILGHSDNLRVICYNTNPAKFNDPVSLMFEIREEVVDASLMSEAELADRMRADGVDIAIDTMGFTYGTRLGTFAERPAPIQVTGWGYATGTIPAMDYIFLDALTRGNDLFFEEVVNMPSVVSYLAPMFCPPVAPHPTGPVTFGAFHCFIKISPEYLELCRRILNGVPGSRIVFKGKEYGEAQLRDRITAVLGAERCEFWPQTLQLDHLDAFKHLDLVLDPFPQTGGITTCEALHQGVLSVTLMGARTIQRSAGAILQMVGAGAGVTFSPDEYVAKAIALTTEARDWLALSRPRWRGRLQQSPVMKDYPAQAEKVMREMWRAYCAR